MQSAITSFYKSFVGQNDSVVIESQPTATTSQSVLTIDPSQQQKRSKQTPKRRSKHNSADVIPDSGDEDDSFTNLMHRALGTSTPAVTSSNSAGSSEVLSNLRDTIKDLIKQKKSLETQVSILNTELTEKQKSEKKNILEIKRLTKLNDSNLKRISQLEGIRKYTVPDVRREDSPIQNNASNNPTAPQSAPRSIPVIQAGRARYDEAAQYRSQPHSTLATAPTQPRSIPVLEPGRAIFDENASYAHAAARGQRQTSSQPRQSASAQIHPRAPPPARIRPEFDAIGTSIIQGSGRDFNQQGAKATVFSSSGARIRHIRSRIEGIIPKDTTSTRPVMTQCAGNDCCIFDEDRVIDEYEGLIKDIRRQRPRAPIVLSIIPLRKNNISVNRRINAVNDYLIERAQHRDNVHTIDVVPKSHNEHFTRKGIHFNKAGKELYAKNVVRAMSPFMRIQNRPVV